MPPVQAPYAEWVAVRARLALLDAHARCAALAADRAAGDAGAAIVQAAQAPHARRVALPGPLNLCSLSKLSSFKSNVHVLLRSSIRHRCCCRRSAHIAGLGWEN